MSLLVKERNKYRRRSNRTETSREEFNFCLIKIFNYLEATFVVCLIKEFDNEPELHEAVKNKAALCSPRQLMP